MRLALILVAAFMVVLDFSIVNVALPSIESELAVTTTVAQWVVTGYAIAFGGLLILGGRAADLFGRRRMFIAGLVLFSLASLAGGLAQDPVLLIASRVVQGAGAAVVAPAALSLITTSFPEGPQRTRAIGLYGSISSVGFVSGQVLGGVLIEWTDWRSVFLVNVPFGLVTVALAPRLLRPDHPAPASPTSSTTSSSTVSSSSSSTTSSSTVAASSSSTSTAAPPSAIDSSAQASSPPTSFASPDSPTSSAAALTTTSARAGGTARRLDIRGAIGITAAVSLAVFAISQAGMLGWTSPVVLGAFAAAIVAAAGFVMVENRHPEPLIRPGLLLRPGPRDGAVIAVMLGLWNGGEMLALSLYLQQALHYSPLATGLVIAPQGIAGFTSGMLGPKVAARFGVRRTLVAAGTIAAAGFVALSWLPSAGWSPLLLMVIPVGLGTAGTSFGAMVLASRGMADHDQGLAGGVINTSRQVGAAIGAALLPSIAEAVHGVAGDRDAMLTAAVAAAVAAVIVLASSRSVAIASRVTSA